MKSQLTLMFLFISTSFFSQTITLLPFAYGLGSPVEITNAGDDRLFVVGKTGTISIVNADGTVNPENFLTLPLLTVASGGEQGLLGLAFDPGYATNGLFYICYTRFIDGAVVVERYNVDPENPNLAVPESAFPIITIPHPDSSHNGGTLRFGPDGYLYIGIGDGTLPTTNAQDVNVNLGKLLRLDVSNSTESLPYSIPPGNPYAGIDGNDEIWALGLRNPWKYSFDRNTGDLWIADVGQTNSEEINHVSGSQAGVNYGWSCYEANDIYSECDTPADACTFPVGFYSHAADLCSIIGGYVYTGSQYPALQNRYIFTDLCSNAMWILNIESGEITSSGSLTGPLNYYTTFGQDINGELYVASSYSGVIYKISGSELSVKSFEKMAFSISPNPSTSEFYVKIQNANYPVEIKIFDVSGKILLQQNIDSDSNPINTDGLQSGMYVVNIKDNAGNTANSKLAVTN